MAASVPGALLIFFLLISVQCHLFLAISPQWPLQTTVLSVVRAFGECWTRKGRHSLWNERKNRFIVKVKYTEQRLAGR